MTASLLLTRSLHSQSSLGLGLGLNHVLSDVYGAEHTILNKNQILDNTIGSTNQMATYMAYKYKLKPLERDHLPKLEREKKFNKNQECLLCQLYILFA